jgi:hypothetical protein
MCMFGIIVVMPESRWITMILIGYIYLSKLVRMNERRNILWHHHSMKSQPQKKIEWEKKNLKRESLMVQIKIWGCCEISPGGDSFPWENDYNLSLT